MAAPPMIVEAAKALQSHTTSNANVIAQHALVPYLGAGRNDHEQRLHEHLETNRTLGLKILAEIDHLAPPRAEGGFYFYLNLANDENGGWPGMADDVVSRLLTDAGVATISGSAFGDPFGIRISYGVPTATLLAGLERVRDFFNGNLELVGLHAISDGKRSAR